MKGIYIDNTASMCTRPAEVFMLMEEETRKLNWLMTDVTGWDSIIGKYEHRNGDNWFFFTGDVFFDIMSSNRMATMNWGVITGFPADIPLEKILESDLPFADRNDDLFVNPVKPMHELGVAEVFVTDITKMAVKADDAVIDRIGGSIRGSSDLEHYNERMMKKRKKEEVKEEPPKGFFAKLFGK